MFSQILDTQSIENLNQCNFNPLMYVCGIYEKKK